MEYLTIEKFTELFQSDNPPKSFRHPDIEEKYQKRDKKKDPKNKKDDSIELLPNDYPYY